MSSGQDCQLISRLTSLRWNKQGDFNRIPSTDTLTCLLLILWIQGQYFASISTLSLSYILTLVFNKNNFSLIIELWKPLIRPRRLTLQWEVFIVVHSWLALSIISTVSITTRQECSNSPLRVIIFDWTTQHNVRAEKLR